MVSDQGTAHDRLAGARGRAKDAVVMLGHFLDGCFLLGSQFAVERPARPSAIGTCILDRHVGTGGLQNRHSVFHRSTREYQPVRMPLSGEIESRRVVCCSTMTEVEKRSESLWWKPGLENVASRLSAASTAAGIVREMCRRESKRRVTSPEIIPALIIGRDKSSRSEEHTSE